MNGPQEDMQETRNLRQRIATLEANKKALEQQLKDSKANFRGIIDHLLEGCQIIDFNWRYLYLNDAVAQHSRFSKEELLGRTMMEAYPGIEQSSMFATLKDCMEKRVPHRLENEFTFPDGSKGWFDLCVEPIPEGIFILSIERTEQKRFEEYTNRHYRLASIGQFAAGIAHDFNNILTAMMGTAQIIEMNPRVPKEVHDDFNVILSQGQRAAQLIRQILDFSRETVIKRQPIDLVTFLKESIKILGRVLPENIEIVENLPQEMWVQANVSQFQQIINNLAANSRDAMPQGGCITIRVSSHHFNTHTPYPNMPLGDWVSWEFSDTGQGISEDIQKHIFEPFYTTKTKEKGTGLGLAQVYGIVQQHDGFIDIKSQAEKGTTFTIYLPKHLENKNLTPQKDIGNIPTGLGQTILVVEDEAPVLRVICALLEKLNYKVISAPNGEEGIKQYHTHHNDISLVLTDMVMPHRSGIQLIETLLETNPNLLFLMMSGYTSTVRQHETLIKKACGILDKPIRIEDLASAIHDALKKST